MTLVDTRTNVLAVHPSRKAGVTFDIVIGLQQACLVLASDDTVQTFVSRAGLLIRCGQKESLRFSGRREQRGCGLLWWSCMRFGCRTPRWSGSRCRLSDVCASDAVCRWVRVRWRRHEGWCHGLRRGKEGTIIERLQKVANAGLVKKATRSYAGTHLRTENSLPRVSGW
jgi:hypothetical protein